MIVKDLIKTVFLNTAIIEKEWIPSLNSDILEGPKYLRPLMESIVLKFKICFLTDPEKLLQRLSLSESILMSFFVKQL